MDTVDHVVGGGGVYGCGLAWEFARRGREVVLLEAETAASGASGGLGQRGIRTNARDPRELPLMKRAHELWPTLADEIQAATGFDRVGHLQLIEREEDVATARARAAEQCRHGIATELVDGRRLRALEPELAPSVVAAMYCAADGVADHTATTRGLARAAERAGAELREHTAVTALRRDGDRVAAVETADGEEIGVGRSVVLLTNTSVPELLEPLGVTVPVFEVLPQALTTEPLDRVPVRHLIGHAHRELALKALPGRERHDHRRPAGSTASRHRAGGG
ncbi:MAG: NAD(P)/FAD-dependent oxidoreductase [Actinomycetota bacterium]